MSIPRYDEATLELERSILNNVTNLESQISKIKLDYKNGLITPIEFIERRDVADEKLNNLKMANEVSLIDLEKSRRFLGWRSERTFWVGFGVRFPLFVMAIIISILISNRQSDQKYRNSALFWLQATCYGMAFYQIIWCFWFSQDYPLSTYWLALFGFSLLAGTFITYQFRYYISVMGKLHRLQAEFMDFLVEMRNEHYEPLLRKVINRGDIYEQQLHIELDKGTKHLENRLNEKASELIN